MKFYTSFDKQLPKHETKQSKQGEFFPNMLNISNFGVSEQQSVSNHPADCHGLLPGWKIPQDMADLDTVVSVGAS